MELGRLLFLILRKTKIARMFLLLEILISHEFEFVYLIYRSLLYLDFVI